MFLDSQFTTRKKFVEQILKQSIFAMILPTLFRQLTIMKVAAASCDCRFVWKSSWLILYGTKLFALLITIITLSLIITGLQTTEWKRTLEVLCVCFMPVCVFAVVSKKIIKGYFQRTTVMSHYKNINKQKQKEKTQNKTNKKTIKHTNLISSNKPKMFKHHTNYIMMDLELSTHTHTQSTEVLAFWKLCDLEWSKKKKKKKRCRFQWVIHHCSQFKRNQFLNIKACTVLHGFCSCILA